MSLWFVTPAWQRPELSAVCFEQRRRVMEHLASHGVEAHCVVVADDENLDSARALGFDTVEQNNEWLGRKFNDGIEYAGKHGAEWIVLIGSDDWIDPAYFLPLPINGLARTSHFYAPVRSDRMATCHVGRQMAGPRVFHRSHLAPSGFRPQAEQITRNTDHSTLAAIGPVNWDVRDMHPYQYVGFRAPPYVTSYDRLVDWWGTGEQMDPWPILGHHFDVDLIERAREIMAG